MADDNKTQTCPYCGKPGIKEETEGVTYYNHGSVIDWKSNPIFVGFKYCPEMPPSKKP